MLQVIVMAAVAWICHHPELGEEQNHWDLVTACNNDLNAVFMKCMEMISEIVSNRCILSAYVR